MKKNAGERQQERPQKRRNGRLRQGETALPASRQTTRRVLAISPAVLRLARVIPQAPRRAIALVHPIILPAMEAVERVERPLPAMEAAERVPEAVPVKEMEEALSEAETVRQLLPMACNL